MALSYHRCIGRAAEVLALFLMIEISGDAHPFFSHVSHRMGGGLFLIITEYLFRSPKRLAKKARMDTIAVSHGKIAHPAATGNSSIM